MSDILDCIEQIKGNDSSLTKIDFYGAVCNNVDLCTLIECLLTYPTFITSIHLSRQCLKDTEGTKIAKYLANTTTLRSLCLSSNLFTITTYASIATALCTNSSLKDLFFRANIFGIPPIIDEMFVNSLRLNPCRSTDSLWQFTAFGWEDLDFKRLTCISEKSAPPSMLEFLLYVHLDTETIKTRIH